MPEQIAEVARSLQGRESVELEDAKTRKEINVAQRKNLRIARFLNRITFCLFAEDTGLLPKDLFTDILKASLQNPPHFAEATESLFRTMAKGGLYGSRRIRHFNRRVALRHFPCHTQKPRRKPSFPPPRRS